MNRELNDLKFYQFKQRLIQKCKESGKVVKFVKEHNTTKTCSDCGNIRIVGSSEVYVCKKCNFTCDRDMNSAKNILMKGLLFNRLRSLAAKKTEVLYNN